MPEKHRRYSLKDKETKSLIAEIAGKLNFGLEHIFESKVNLEIIETDFAKIYLINNKPLIAKLGEDIFPTLVSEELFRLMPRVIVDMGAVPHVCNGADVMAPGIVRFQGEIRKGRMVFIADEKHGKPIAVGEALRDVKEKLDAREGAVVRNVHFVGDKLWNFMKTI